MNITRRHAWDPRPDLAGLRILYRAMRDDLRRLADLTTRLEHGETAVPSGRAVAIQTYVTMLSGEIARHHSGERRELWPVVAASAGGAIDMAAYSTDLPTLLDDLRVVAKEFAVDPPAAVEPLAATLRTLSNRVDEHIGEVEQDVLPMIFAYVPAADYECAERRMWEGRQLKWALPWVERFTTPEEARLLKASYSIAARLTLAVSRRSYAALENSVFP